MPRSDAEKKYGMTIYQGGAVPGKSVRIVEIPGVDVEACGGTHLNNTSETGKIKIIKSQKIQDGIVRLKFTAGNATVILEKKNAELTRELEFVLNVGSDLIVCRVEELLEKWKHINKALKGGKIDEKDLELTSMTAQKGDILTNISKLLKVKKDQIPSKVRKMYSEWLEGKEKLKKFKTI